jgi:5-methylcytosine-specific restriction endonuclease McrA
MPALKLCRCGKKIPLEQIRCEDCQVKHDEQERERHREYKHNRTDKDAQRFYSSKNWRTIQLKIKTRDYGLCKLCWSNNKVKYMDTVHHIVPLEECKDMGLMESNLISLCESCHKRIHKEYEDISTKRKAQEELNKIVKGEGEVKKF